MISVFAEIFGPCNINTKKFAVCLACICEHVPATAMES